MRIAAGGVLLCWSAAAAAIDDDFCRNGSFPVEHAPFALAAVGGNGRANFWGDMNGCPAAEARCRENTYVVPGDRLVTGRVRGAFTCAYFPNRGGGSAGWIESRRLRAVAVAPRPPLSAWLGQWSAEGNPMVRFRVRRKQLTVDGDSYWPSPNPSLEERPGGPNIGSIAGPVRRSGNQAREPECNVTFTLLGDLLIGADPDMKCGGANVSFSGVYRRQRR
jgi:hypothetical protein